MGQDEGMIANGPSPAPERVEPVSTTVGVPLCRPSLGDQEIDAVVEVLKSGWIAHGEYNSKFEGAFAKLIGVPQAVTMNSCTSALEVALKIEKIRGEVIIPSFTWVATANAVVTAGATPVFCEVDEATRNVTAEDIAAQLTPRTEAVIVVHYGGQPCAMDEITALCQRKNLFLIEDSAETIGATWNGHQAGSFGVGCFSFFPTKNITTGEGGMLTCRDEEFARRVRAMAAHGISSTTFQRESAPQPWHRSAEMAGHNYRMSNVLAAIGYHQIKKLDQLNAARVAHAARYDDRLAGLSELLTTPKVLKKATHVYQMYTVQVPSGIRDKVLNQIRSFGIGASVHFDPPVHLQPFYKSSFGAKADLPVTERLSRTLLILPRDPDMTRDDQDRVVDQLRVALLDCQA